MSAWMIFTGMGFYPVAPASNEYVIGRPFVKRATINLPDGKKFEVVAEGLTPEHPYIESVSLNGKPLTRSFLRHEEIVGGGELRFVMGSTPNKTRATSVAARPFSMSEAH